MRDARAELARPVWHGKGGERAARGRHVTAGLPNTGSAAWAFEWLGTHRDLFDMPIEAFTLAWF